MNAPLDFDMEKAQRIAQAFLDAIKSEDANAGEVCGAICAVLGGVLETAPTRELAEDLRSTMIKALQDTPVKGGLQC